MLSTGSPNYVYRPLSPQRRKAMQIAARARFGLKADQKKLYGVALAEMDYRRIFRAIYRIAQKVSPLKAAEAVRAYLASGIWALRPFLNEIPNRATYRARLKKQNAARRLRAKKKKMAAQRYRREKRIAAKVRAKMDRQIARLEAVEDRRAQRAREIQSAREERFRRSRDQMSPTEAAAAQRREERRAVWRRMTPQQKLDWHESVQMATRLARQRKEELKAARAVIREAAAQKRKALSERQAVLLQIAEDKKRLRQQRIESEATRKASAAEDKKRLQTLALYAEDVPLSQLALFAGVTQQTVLNWIEKSRKGTL